MIIILRGHIRKTFESKQLYYFLRKLKNIIPTLRIYIHTWNKLANTLSWRAIQDDSTLVTEETVRTYFDDLSPCITIVGIDDDSTIQLVGNVEGMVCSSKMPLRGWKNLWYGQYRVMHYLFHNKDVYNEAMVLNLRFDVFNNSNNFTENMIVGFIFKQRPKIFQSNEFYHPFNFFGIDNCYIGSVYTMYQLGLQFFYNLDEIMANYPDLKSQEFLIRYVNNRLFPQQRKAVYESKPTVTSVRYKLKHLSLGTEETNLFHDVPVSTAHASLAITHSQKHQQRKWVGNLFF